MNYYNPYDVSFMYDWVDPTQTRTPENYPYSFDAHYIWRENLKGASGVYSDRMWEWDREKAKMAFDGVGQRAIRDKQKTKKVIEKYYDGKYECVGYALCCNVSNGYEIGIFYLKEK